MVGLFPPVDLGTRAVPPSGGRIVLQRCHVGRLSHTSLQPDGARRKNEQNARACKRFLFLNRQGRG